MRTPTLRQRPGAWSKTCGGIEHAQGSEYRLDFALMNGHQWREATQHQVQNDKSRDRKLTAAGWQVLRFTGSEVYRAPAACVREVREPIIRKRTARVAG